MVDTDKPDYLMPPKKVSNLEQVFCFRDRHFNNYMLMQAARGNVANLFTWQRAMEKSERSLVRYASGWAAAEISLSMLKNLGRRTRINALNTARQLWANAAEEFARERFAQTNEAMRGRLLTLELQAILALTYFPMFEAGVEVLMGYKRAASASFFEPKKEECLHHTRELAIILDQRLSTTESAEETRRLLGLLYELTAATLLLKDSLNRFVILPSSLRQDNHVDSTRRADLIALARQKPIFKRLIQVKPFEDDLLSKTERSLIYAHQDFTTDLMPRPIDCVHTAILDLKGLASPEESATLAVLGRMLTLRLLEETRPTQRTAS